MTTPEFAALAAAILDEHLALDPVTATSLGDHRFDDRLPASGPEDRADELTARRVRLAQLDALPDAFDAEERVDREILAHQLRRRVFELTELREHAWNPLEANPGTRAVPARRPRVRAGRGPDALGCRPTGRDPGRPGAGSPTSILPRDARRPRRDRIGQFTGTRTLIATELETLGRPGASTRAAASRRSTSTWPG